MMLFLPAFTAVWFYYVNTFVVKNKRLVAIFEILTPIVIAFCLLCYVDILLNLISIANKTIFGGSKWYSGFYI